MASAIIHMAVAKRVSEVMKIDSEDFIIGSIAPDVAKIVGLPRKLTHYIPLDSTSDIPNIDVFLNKYKKYLNNLFELGCFVHLVTDVLWFKEFIPNFIIDENTVMTKDNEKVNLNGIETGELIYNDYTNINYSITKYYDLDLGIFYKESDFPNSHIDEIKNEYFMPLMKKMKEVSMASSDYSYLFDITKITHFVEYAALYVLDEIKKIEGE